MEEKLLAEQHRHMRKVAFIGVVVSTVAVIASVVTLPLIYNYIQSLQSHLLNELDFCKSRSRDMWLEIFTIQSAKPVTRQRREWLFGQWVNAASGMAGAQAYAGAATP
ncbi:Cuticle collagen 6, partial [Trichinella pseudospiralis]